MMLGVDPAIAHCGWAVVDSAARVLDLGVLLSEPEEGVDEAVDRERRADVQADALLAIVARHGITAIAAEALSFGGAPKARFAMAVSLCLSWGVLAGIARTLGLDTYSVPPKRWQHAVQPGAGKRIDYARVERDLSGYVQVGAAKALGGINPRHRNHALDGAAIGMFAVLRPREVDIIRRRRTA